MRKRGGQHTSRATVYKETLPSFLPNLGRLRETEEEEEEEEAQERSTNKK